MKNRSDPDDPRVRLLRNARREARMVLGVWAVFFLWVVGYSWLRGYQRPAGGPLVESGLARAREAADFSTIAGLPDWIFWGIFVPWILGTLITIGIGVWGMRDDDLGGQADGSEDGGD